MVVDHGSSRGDGAPLCSVRTNIPIKNVIGAASQPFTQLRPTAAACNTTDGDRDSLALADQNDQSFAASDTRVEQIALQHRVVLGDDRDNDGRVNERSNWPGGQDYPPSA